MLIFKIFGSTSILLSAAIFYLETRKYEKEKLKQTDAYIAFMRYIKKQIDCFSAPITSIIKQCGKNLLSDCGINYENINDFSSDSLFSDLIESCDFYIDGEAIEILQKFGQEFGKTYRDEQLRSCDYYTSELVKYREKIAQEIPKERKMRFAICFCISMSVILLLI